MNININYLDYYNMFYNFLTDNQNKNIILEPISCMVKLILLNYKDKGTKKFLSQITLLIFVNRRNFKDT